MVNYENNNSYFNSPFEILYKLEKEIKFKNDPDRTLEINYYRLGFMIFILEKVYQKGQRSGRRDMQTTYPDR